MNMLNNLFDRTIHAADKFAYSDPYLISRLAKSSLLAGPVLIIEIAVIAQEALICAPLNMAGLTIGLTTKVVSLITGSQIIRNFAKGMPTLSDFLYTIYKVIKLSVGLVLTASVGMTSSRTNLKLHTQLGLAMSNL